MATDLSDAWTELHVALGLVVTAGAKMEDTLRICFCILDASENADVVAAGQDVGWLRDYCGDLARVSSRIDQEGKDAIGKALARCKSATEARNELVHGLHNWPWFTSRDRVGWGWIERSRRHKPVLVKEWTVSDIRNVWLELDDTAEGIRCAVSRAVGPKAAAYWTDKPPNWVDERGEPWPF